MQKILHVHRSHSERCYEHSASRPRSAAGWSYLTQSVLVQSALRPQQDLRVDMLLT